MKGRVVILDQVADQLCAASMTDGVLDDLMIDPADDTPLPGAIYRGIADRPMKGQGGIFLRLPTGQRGFLRRMSGIVPGQPLLVQVSGPAEDGKALPVTTRLLFKSVYAIITPGAAGLNISRQIDDEGLRAVLEQLASDVMEGAAEGMGLILRSACTEATVDEIRDDIQAMRSLAEAVLADLDGPPELLLDGAGAHDIALRDWVSPSPDAIHTQPGGFAHYGIDEMARTLLSTHVPLLGGGHMRIEPTSALLAIDVNTGGDTSIAAALKANIAAARALPRELRLRGLGGQIVIDFAPLPRKDRGVLDQVIKSAFRAPGMQKDAQLVGWTSLGLYELSYRRTRLPLASLAQGLFD